MEGNGQVADLQQARRYAGAIDCDLHPAVPGMSVLMPYLDDYWREMVSVRALDRLNLNLTSYPQNSPLSCRPDWTLIGDESRDPRSKRCRRMSSIPSGRATEFSTACRRPGLSQ